VTVRERAAAVVGFALVVLSAGTMALLATGIGTHGGLSALDQPTLSWVMAHRAHVPLTLALAVSTVAGEAVVAVVAALLAGLLAWRRRFDQALLLVVGFGGADFLALVVKYVVGRPRPPVADQVGQAEATLSFPSGHTIGVAALTLLLGYLWWRHRPGVRRGVLGVIGAAVLTALMAASRLYLACHWLTDVIGSAVLAVGVLGVMLLVDLWLGRHGPRWWRAASRSPWSAGLC